MLAALIARWASGLVMPHPLYHVLSLTWRPAAGPPQARDTQAPLASAQGSGAGVVAAPRRSPGKTASSAAGTPRAAWMRWMGRGAGFIVGQQEGAAPPLRRASAHW